MEPINQTAMRLGTVVRHVGEEVIKTGLDPNIIGSTSDDDIMTAADKIAADTMREQLYYSGIPCALLLEETGTLENIHNNPQWIVIADELDGSRPARLGFDAAGMCSVTAALIPIDKVPTLANVTIAASYSLSDHTFVASRGNGIKRDGKRVEQLLTTPPTTIPSARIFNEHMGQCGLLEGIYKQAFIPANGGGHFYIASSSAAARMMIQRKAGAHVHLGKRLRDKFPHWEKYLVGSGKKASMMPWDLASYYLLLTEAGATVTDGFGQSIENLTLMGKGETGRTSVISASNAELHRNILRELDKVDHFLETHNETISYLLAETQSQ